MKKTVGTVLWSVGHLINFIILVVAVVYGFGTIIWMHIPVLDVVKVVALAAFLPLAIAWVIRAWGKRLKSTSGTVVLTPTRKRLLTGVTAVMVIACGIVAWNGYTAYRCATGQSRWTPASEAAARKIGVRQACSADLSNYDLSFGSLAAALGKLAFKPVDLTGTPFSRLENLGGKVEYIVDIPSRLYRGFRMPDGHRLTLSEHDMSADGSRSYRRPADEPERINGLPARLDVLEAAPGQAVSLLTWSEGRRDYELWLDANVAGSPLRAQLFALAASLPASVPACPNEPPQQPMDAADFGLTGHPSLKPMTQAEMAGMANKRERPCK